MKPSNKFTGFLANQIRAKAAESREAEWQWMSQQIGIAGRLTLSPEVMQGSLRRKLDLEASRPILAAGLRLPHDPCFIEYPAAAVEDIVGMAPGNTGRGHGILFWTEGDGSVQARVVLATEFGPMCVPALAIYGTDDIVGRSCDHGLPLDARQGFEWAAVLFAWMGLRILAMLTAKNAPLSVGEEQDFSALNKRRQAHGRHTLVGSRPVRWDLSRMERRFARSGEPLSPAARSQAVAHLVRGHLKVRKSGVFWWSPHVRLTGSDDSLPLGRDYTVRLGRRA